MSETFTSTVLITFLIYFEYPLSEMLEVWSGLDVVYCGLKNICICILGYLGPKFNTKFICVSCIPSLKIILCNMFSVPVLCDLQMNSGVEFSTIYFISQLKKF